MDKPLLPLVEVFFNRGENKAKFLLYGVRRECATMTVVITESGWWCKNGLVRLCVGVGLGLGENMLFSS